MILFRTLLAQALGLYATIVFVSVILTWFPAKGVVADIRTSLALITEPFLSVFRRFVPPIGGLDFSPVIAIIVLQVLQRIVLTI